MHNQQTGVEAIAAERQRQIDVEGYTLEHDAGHDISQIIRAAQAYTATAIGGARNYRFGLRLWPWHPDGYKPSTRRRDLVKAGALIAAAIDAHDAHNAQEK